MRFPPITYPFHPVIDHETATLGFQALACFDQLFPLPMDGSLLLLFFSRYSHQRQRISISLEEAVQL